MKKYAIRYRLEISGIIGTIHAENGNQALENVWEHEWDEQYKMIYDSVSSDDSEFIGVEEIPEDGGIKKAKDIVEGDVMHIFCNESDIGLILESWVKVTKVSLDEEGFVNIHLERIDGSRPKIKVKPDDPFEVNTDLDALLIREAEDDEEE